MTDLSIEGLIGQGRVQLAAREARRLRLEQEQEDEYRQAREAARGVFWQSVRKALPGVLLPYATLASEEYYMWKLQQAVCVTAPSCLPIICEFEEESSQWSWIGVYLVDEPLEVWFGSERECRPEIRYEQRQFEDVGEALATARDGLMREGELELELDQKIKEWKGKGRRVWIESMRR